MTVYVVQRVAGPLVGVFTNPRKAASAVEHQMRDGFTCLTTPCDLNDYVWEKPRENHD